ncbi:MAG: DMT family transporter [Alphaproteobacteria bacterium]|nr:DMT family transporter [Alphaproteobacteria bacterium]
MVVNISILLALSLAWASNYVFISTGDRGFEPFTATAFIAVLAAIFLLIVVRGVMRRPLWPTLRAKPAVPVVMAFTALAAPQLSSVIAENSISPDLATVVGTAVPILTFLVGACVLRTVHATALNFVGVAIAVAGIIVFADPEQLFGQQAELIGIAIMLSGGVVFVANGLYAAQRTSDLDQYVLTVWIVVFAAIGLSVAALIHEGVPDRMPGWDCIAALAASGVFGTGLAYLLYYLLIARAGAGFTSLYAFLVPPLGVALTAVFLDGGLSLRHALGVAIVLAGLALVLWRRKDTQPEG